MNEICKRIVIDSICNPEWFHYVGRTILIETAPFDEHYSVTSILSSPFHSCKKTILICFMNNSDYTDNHTEIMRHANFEIIWLPTWSGQWTWKSYNLKRFHKMSLSYHFKNSRIIWYGFDMNGESMGNSNLGLLICNFHVLHFISTKIHLEESWNLKDCTKCIYKHNSCKIHTNAKKSLCCMNCNNLWYVTDIPFIIRQNVFLSY